MTCEKCWNDAYFIMLSIGKPQSEAYVELIEKRKDNPCTPREQAGDYWNEEKQCDKRELKGDPK